MNYSDTVDAVYITYADHAFLVKNWEQERALVDRFAAILGVPTECYTVTQPASERECVVVKFSPALQLPVEEEEAVDDGDGAVGEEEEEAAPAPDEKA